MIGDVTDAGASNGETDCWGRDVEAATTGAELGRDGGPIVYKNT